jgi:hypothetical protein
LRILGEIPQVNRPGRPQRFARNNPWILNLFGYVRFEERTFVVAEDPRIAETSLALLNKLLWLGG